jgi:hypothetical protein
LNDYYLTNDLDLSNDQQSIEKVQENEMLGDETLEDETLEDEANDLRPPTVTLRPHVDWNEQYTIMQSLELSDADIFSEMEYILFFFFYAGWYTDGKSPWYEYAILGGEYSNFNDGIDLFERINALYTTRRDPVGNHADTQNEGLFRHLFERHVVGLSSDGTRIFTRMSLSRYNHGVGPGFYEVIEGRNRLFELTGEYWIAFSAITPNIRFITTDTMMQTFNSIHADIEITFPRTRERILNFEETRFAYFIQQDEGIVINVLDIHQDEIIFTSDLLITGSGSVWMRHLGENHIVFEDWFNYYKLDMETNTVTFLFTMPRGIISPDGRYLAFASIHPLDLWELKESPELTEGLDFGIFVHDIFTKETVFYPVDMSHAYIGDFSDFGYRTISWTNISALYELLKEAE